MVIRELDVQADLPAVAELLNTVWVTPVTAAILRQWEVEAPPGRLRRQWVAVAEDGRLIGRGLVQRFASAPQGQYFLDVVVHPDFRRQGAGSQLYWQLAAFAGERGATSYKAEVRDNCPDCLRFAQARGYTIRRHFFESVLDLQTFDETPFLGIEQAVQRQGIRLFSLADVGEAEEYKRQLYEVNRASSLDDPASSGEFASYEEFQRIVFVADWYRAAGQILAADGEHVIGLCAVAFNAQNNTAYNNITGVLPAYRGRQIAQALKLRGIRFARGSGAKSLRTHNDEQNEAMLAINRKFGYVRRDGEYHLIKHLNAADS